MDGATLVVAHSRGRAVLCATSLETRLHRSLAWVEEAGGKGEQPFPMDGVSMTIEDTRRRASPEEPAARIPPGQRLTDGWPILHYGDIPRIALDTWRFHVVGLVEQQLSLSWPDLMALPQTTVHCDIHCVTHWSRLDNDFTGVLFRDLAALARIRPEACHVMVHSFGGYTTNVSLEELMDEDVLFAHSHDGQPLAPEHGWPLRLVVPKLYLWKSAKWVRGIELIDGERAGFWEQYGYHIHGDPWKEERYS